MFSHNGCGWSCASSDLLAAGLLPSTLSPLIFPQSSERLLPACELSKYPWKSNATPCSAMIKDTQVRQTQSHIQLPSQRVRRSFFFVLPLPSQLSWHRAGEWNTSIRIKRSDQGFEDVTRSLSYLKLSDKGRAPGWRWGWCLKSRLKAADFREAACFSLTKFLLKIKLLTH